MPNDYEKWYKGSLVTNPITWDDEKTTTYEQHKGLAYYDGMIYPNSLSIELIDGMVWARTPKVQNDFGYRLSRLSLCRYNDFLEGYEKTPNADQAFL